MSTMPKSFSFPSYRRLYRYLGETDAMVELTELAARSFLDSARQSENVREFVEAMSSKHGVRVNLGEIECLSRHLARSYIVTVYQSAECFLHEFRREHCGLYKRDWSGDGVNVDPLTVTLRNIAASQREAEDKIGRDIISLFDYYRSVRNWVVHTKESDNRKPQEDFDKIAAYSSKHKEEFESILAPNPPEKLTFHDFIFFSRLTKHIAEKISLIAQPSADHWLQTFATAKFRKYSNNRDRMRNAVILSLRTDYGMDEHTAQWLAEQLCDSLA